MGNEVEEIKQKLDIVEFVKEYVTITQAGQNYKGLCPFHREKNPSFMVSRPRQIFHCFGCHEGGDIFTFLQKMEGLDFPEALRILAEKAGVKLEKKAGVSSDKKQVLFDIIEASVTYYQNTLFKKPQGELGRAYIKKRGLSSETCEAFRFGFAPDDFQYLTDHLRKKFSESDLLASGMAVKRERGGLYDRFRGRVMIPIYNTQGVICGFTGRTVKPDEKMGKYINTPQTLIYDKGSLLFGLFHAKQAIRQAGYAIIVEGNLDMISSYQAGVKNVMASGGTALTEKQATLLKRYTDNVMVCFDQDAAGIQAALRGVEILLAHEFNVKVAKVLEGKDPDECIKKDVKLWHESLKQAKPFMEFVWEQSLKNKDVLNPTDKKKIATSFLPWVKRLSSPIERNHYIKKLADTLQVSEQSIQDSLTPSKKTTHPLKNILPKEHRKGWDLVTCILLNQPQESPKVFSHIPLTDIPQPYKKILESIQNPSILSEEETKQRNILELLYQKEFANLPSRDILKELGDQTRFLKRDQIKTQLKVLETRLRAEEQKTPRNTMYLAQLLQQFQHMTQTLRDLF